MGALLKVKFQRTEDAGVSRAMRSYVRLRRGNKAELPPELQSDDVRFADELVRHFLEVFTEPGQVVFDPFAGFGTTLAIAEGMGRQAYGMELDEARCNFARSQIANPKNLICGDARELSRFEWPPFDFSITSPPFMNQFEHPQNPLTAYSTTDGHYGTYLRELKETYRQLDLLMKPGGLVVIEAANLKTDGGVTPLAWDIARTLGEVLRFEGEIIACWDSYGYGYEHSYCLVFSCEG